MTPLAIFGITNDGLNLAVNLLLLFLVVFWLALVYWTFADARRRITDPMLVGCATAASLFPFAGTIVYMIVRPPEFLEDVRERDLEIAAAEARLASIGQYVCPHCSNEVEKTFLRCPNCHRRLKEPCMTCGQGARPQVVDLPLLRGGRRPARRPAAAPPARAPARTPALRGRRRRPRREGAQRPAAARPAPEAGPGSSPEPRRSPPGAQRPPAGRRRDARGAARRRDRGSGDRPEPFPAAGRRRGRSGTAPRPATGLIGRGRPASLPALPLSRRHERGTTWTEP